jgi:hypothetical protein
MGPKIDVIESEKISTFGMHLNKAKRVKVLDSLKFTASQ